MVFVRFLIYADGFANDLTAALLKFGDDTTKAETNDFIKRHPWVLTS